MCHPPTTSIYITPYLKRRPTSCAGRSHADQTVSPSLGIETAKAVPKRLIMKLSH